VHRQIIDNLAAFPGGEGDLWWVIDRWMDAETLEDRWEANSWKAELAPQLAWELAQGLAALHQADIVFRELSPRRILIAADDGRACLTDFELAKLLGPAPTVSADWPDDPYRAPEVESGQASVRSDFYSWATIVVEAFCGSGHAPQSVRQMAKIDGVPNSVQLLLKKCLAPGPSDRPTSIDQVVTVLQRSWPKLARE
jgi:serine/threonine protein kinase